MAPPPAKADCVSASGKTRPFAPTVRADFHSGVISVISYSFMSFHCESKRDGLLQNSMLCSAKLPRIGTLVYARIEVALRECSNTTSKKGNSSP